MVPKWIKPIKEQCCSLNQDLKYRRSWFVDSFSICFTDVMEVKFFLVESMGRMIRFGSICFISNVNDLYSCKVVNSVFLVGLCLIILIHSLEWEGGGGSNNGVSFSKSWMPSVEVLDMASCIMEVTSRSEVSSKYVFGWDFFDRMKETSCFI